MSFGIPSVEELRAAQEKQAVSKEAANTRKVLVEVGEVLRLYPKTTFFEVGGSYSTEVLTFLRSKGYEVEHLQSKGLDGPYYSIRVPV